MVPVGKTLLSSGEPPGGSSRVSPRDRGVNWFRLLAIPVGVNRDG